MAKIAIIGSGMVGLAQAIAFAQNEECGFVVDVFDRVHPKDLLNAKFDGRTSAIALRSYKFLDSIGAWGEMIKYGQPINDIRVSDSDSMLFTHFDHKEIGQDAFGYIIENRHIRTALYNRALEFDNIKIIVQEAAEIPTGYDLVIGADGKFSKIRELAGIETKKRNYKQSGIVCVIEHEKPHEGLAVEKFLPAGPFAVLPMQGNKSSLVWTEPTDLAPIYMGMEDDEFLLEIEKRCDWLGELKLTEGRWSYPLSLSHAEIYIKLAQAPHGLAPSMGLPSSQDAPHEPSLQAPVVLIGDAAHGIHPIAGQGVNLGYRDVQCLTELVIERLQLGLTIESALADYEKERKSDNTKMILATDTLNRLFSNNITPLKLARDVGLGLVNEIKPLKKFFMKAAAGKK